MSDVVVVRPMSAMIYVKCPFCNTEGWLDRTGTFLDSTKFRCDGCGALYDETLVAIHSLHSVVSNDDLKDEDITVIMAGEEARELLRLATTSPTRKITYERTCFHYAMVTCPFCSEQCITRYNSPQPFPAQWCPTEECKAELVTTISAMSEIGGNLEDWYKKEMIGDEIQNDTGSQERTGGVVDPPNSAEE